MTTELKTCENCSRENFPESSFCDLCGSPLDVLVECSCGCCHPDTVCDNPDYPEAVFADLSERPEAVFSVY